MLNRRICSMPQFYPTTNLCIIKTCLIGEYVLCHRYFKKSAPNLATLQISLIPRHQLKRVYMQIMNWCQIYSKHGCSCMFSPCPLISINNIVVASSILNNNDQWWTTLFIFQHLLFSHYNRIATALLSQQCWYFHHYISFDGTYIRK